MNGPWLKHLLWKDLRLIRSLVLAVLIAPLVFALIASVIRWTWTKNIDDVEGLFGFLLFFPYLVSLGAPPMLVGTENEERTFDWLRRLPVAWWQVLLSKVIASGCVLSAALVWTGVLLLVCHLQFDFSPLPASSNPSFSTAVGWGVVVVVYSSFVVLTCGFLTAFVIRNALASALAVIPLAITWLVAVTFLGDVVSRHLLEMRAGVQSGVVVAMLSLAIHLIVFAVIAKCARSRFLGPSDQPVRWLPERSQTRPVMLPLRMTNRPSRVRALLWQHAMQSRWVLILVGAIAVVVLVLIATFPEYETWLDNLSVSSTIPVLVLLHLGLGVSAFHGDQRIVRRHFFSDRGLSPTLIWWTRLIVPAGVSIGITTVWTLIVAQRDAPGGLRQVLWMMPPVFCLLFLVGASTGQWFRRGAMAFFVAPAVAYFAAMALAIAMIPVTDDVGWRSISLLGGICFVCLLMSTWHVNRRWLQGGDGAALWLPAWGWIGLPIGLTAIVSMFAFVLLNR